MGCVADGGGWEVAGGREDHEGRLGAGVEQLLRHLVAGRGARLVGGAGGAHNLVKLAPIHFRLIPETLGRGDERDGDGGTGGGVLPSRPNLEIACSHCAYRASACTYASIRRGATNWEQPR